MVGREIENYTKKGELVHAFSFFGSQEEFEAYVETTPYMWDGKKVNESSVFFVEDTGKVYMLDTNKEWHELETGAESTSDYSHLINKPKLNGIQLAGEKGNTDLGITKLIEVENNTTVNGYSVPQLTKADVENAFNALQSGIPCHITDATGKYTYKVKQVDTNDEDIFVCFDFCDVMILNYKLGVNDTVTITYKEIGGDKLYRHTILLEDRQKTVYEEYMSLKFSFLSSTPEEYDTIESIWEEIAKAVYLPCVLHDEFSNCYYEIVYPFISNPGNVKDIGWMYLGYPYDVPNVGVYRKTLPYQHTWTITDTVSEV